LQFFPRVKTATLKNNTQFTVTTEFDSRLTFLLFFFFSAAGFDFFLGGSFSSWDKEVHLW